MYKNVPWKCSHGNIRTICTCQGKGRCDFWQVLLRSSTRDHQLASQSQHCFSFYNHAIVLEFAPHLSAPFRDLTRMQARLTESLSPIWRERTVRRASHRIFRNAITWSEVTRDEIGPAARSCDRDSRRMKRLKQ